MIILPLMEKVALAKQFAHRLREAMMNAGFNSQRSSSGISINMLAEITGHSTQICRKYIRGEAIPEPVKLIDIASKLKVSAGWLLFGDVSNNTSIYQTQLTISRDLLHYIFTKAAILYTADFEEYDVSNFLMELINDISSINASEEQSKKIIDLAFTSVKHFNNQLSK